MACHNRCRPLVSEAVPLKTGFVLRTCRTFIGTVSATLILKSMDLRATLSPVGGAVKIKRTPQRGARVSAHVRKAWPRWMRMSVGHHLRVSFARFTQCSNGSSWLFARAAPMEGDGDALAFLARSLFRAVKKIPYGAQVFLRLFKMLLMRGVLKNNDLRSGEFLLIIANRCGRRFIVKAAGQ